VSAINVKGTEKNKIEPFSPGVRRILLYEVWRVYYGAMHSVYRRFRSNDVLKGCGTTPRDQTVCGTSRPAKLATFDAIKTSIPSQAKAWNLTAMTGKQLRKFNVPKPSELYASVSRYPATANFLGLSEQAAFKYDIKTKERSLGVSLAAGQ
jgi:hypothetical protein